MNRFDIELQNQKFAFQHKNNSLLIKAGAGDIPLIEIQNKHASALISQQGAHLLSWIPQGEEEVIWLSEQARFEVGRSIRGGVPICWPWFGAHHANPAYPAHGFARTGCWEIIATEALDDGSSSISFTLKPKRETEQMWPQDTTVQFTIIVGEKLRMELTSCNQGQHSIIISQALHTYFNVGDIEQVLLHGLNETDYLDKLDSFKRKQQHGSLTINQEVDRIYLNTSSVCVIEDKALNREISITKGGSRSTVVWNPWQETANKMGDLGELGYSRMLCVESSNAADDVVSIAAGEKHQLWVEYDCDHQLSNWVVNN